MIKFNENISEDKHPNVEKISERRRIGKKMTYLNAVKILILGEKEDFFLFNF